MPLSSTLVNEETIATLYDHLQSAAATARHVLATEPLSPDSEKKLWAIVDSWTFCQTSLLEGEVPERER